MTLQRRYWVHVIVCVMALTAIGFGALGIGAPWIFLGGLLVGFVAAITAPSPRAFKRKRNSLSR